MLFQNQYKDYVVQIWWIEYDLSKIFGVTEMQPIHLYEYTVGVQYPRRILDICLGAQISIRWIYSYLFVTIIYSNGEQHGNMTY